MLILEILTIKGESPVQNMKLAARQLKRWAEGEPIPDGDMPTRLSDRGRSFAVVRMEEDGEDD